MIRFAFIRIALFLVLAPGLPSGLLASRTSFGSVARAQTTDVNAEAQVFFERGNRFFEQSARARGARRTQLLEEALQAYVATLRIVRSRNALFNAAVVLERLERPNEAFTYLVEYLAIEGLGESERREGQTRLEALRPRVAVLRVYSVPAGAEVYVDRLDLAPRGRTPLEIAVPAGPRLVVVRAPHHADMRMTVEAVVGAQHDARFQLTPTPVAIEITIAGDEGTLLIDGERAAPGPQALTPGEHVATLLLPDGRRRDERFVVQAGDTPRRLTLEAPTRVTATLVVQSDRPATVRVDGDVVGQGVEVRAILDPGPHELVVEVPDAPVQRRHVELAAHAEARVQMRFAVEPSRRFGAWPGMLAVATGVATAAWAGLALGARVANGEYDDRCPTTGTYCQSQFDRVERLNLSADLVLGVAGALLVTTIVLFARRGQDTSSALSSLELQLGPSFGGLGGRF